MDGVEDVYMFLDDQEGGSDATREREELPTGVITMLTRCYSPSCGEGTSCYAFSCPRKVCVWGLSIWYLIPSIHVRETMFWVCLLCKRRPPSCQKRRIGLKPSMFPSWILYRKVRLLDKGKIRCYFSCSLVHRFLSSLSIIHKLITKEEQYLQDLDLVESVFIKPLRAANPPVIASHLDDFIDELFGNILDLRECNRRLLEVMYVRQREESPVILRIGDIFLNAATEFRFAYPTYIGHYPVSEKRLKDETEANPEFRLFLEVCTLSPGFTHFFANYLQP